MSNSTQPKPIKAVDVSSAYPEVDTAKLAAEKSRPPVQFSKYLRDRPFLVITIVRRAGKNAKTHVAGWTDRQDNWDSFEQPVVVDRVNDTHMRNANVIIDVLQGRAVKNSFSAHNTDEEVTQHYLAKYAKYVEDAFKVWAKNRK